MSTTYSKNAMSVRVTVLHVRVQSLFVYIIVCVIFNVTQWRRQGAKGLKLPQFLLQPLRNFCVK